MMKNILIVEDEEIERNALKMIIKESNLPVTLIGEASNGEEALRLLEKHRVDLVFMDIRIPGRNGLEISKIVKEKYPSCSIIITTAHDEFELAHKAIKLNIEDYLLKPIRRNKIVESIKKFCLDKTDSTLDKYNEKIHSIISSIIQEKYLLSLTHAEELIDLIYENSSDNIQNIWTIVNQSAGIIYSDIDNFKITNKTAIKKGLLNIETNRKIYSNKYILKLHFINFIKLIIKELLDIKNKYIENTSGVSTFINIDDIIAYIHINIDQSFSLDETAKFFNISPYYLSRIFKKQTGLNFTKYISILKINISKELLAHTDMQIINIALDLGYREANYFSKVFKNIVGITPSNYREEYRSIK